MDVRTRSSSLDGPRAWAVLAGALAALAVPAGVAASRYELGVTLVQGISGGAVAAIVLGVAGLLGARRLRRRFQRTLGRSGGLRAASAARWLGLLGLCLGLAAAIALGFFGLLSLFAS